MSPADGGEGDLAPVIPLFGGQAPPAWNATWAHDPVEAVGVGEGSAGAAGDDPEQAARAAEEAAGAAEQALLRRLRTRSLSVAEARQMLRERDLDAETVEAVLEAFGGRGYLDDAALAEQLVHAGVDRKGQGRHVIAQTLAARGIPREVADTALAALPDDDAERALAYARRKAAAMGGLDREVALRRLAGQLARRGYGARSLEAARAALDELARPARAAVRFDG